MVFVSILVFVELALDAWWSRYGGVAVQVSILVFVELALDVLFSGMRSVDDQGFQSLFSWNLLLMSGFFSFFFPFDTVKPLVLSLPLA